MRNVILAVSFLALNACGMVMRGSNLESDGGWSHSRLRSADGTDISVDFRAVGLRSGTFVAAPVWINVVNQKFSRNETMQAIIAQGLWRDSSGSSEKPLAEFASPMQIDLTFAGDGRYTGVLPDNIRLNAGGNVEGYLRQQLSIIGNGRPLIDPVTGRTSFMLNMVCAVDEVGWLCH